MGSFRRDCDNQAVVGVCCFRNGNSDYFIHISAAYIVLFTRCKIGAKGDLVEFTKRDGVLGRNVSRRRVVTVYPARRPLWTRTRFRAAGANRRWDNYCKLRMSKDICYFNNRRISREKNYRKIQAMAQQFQLPDGRYVDYAVNGPEDGYPLVWIHGTPGAYIPVPNILAACEKKGVKVITLSRAGYGGSSRNKGRKIVDAVADLHALNEHLGVKQCIVGGWSGGGMSSLPLENLRNTD